MKQRRTVTVRETEQLRAIASPLAHRIIGAMEHLGRATVAEIAESIGAPPESLYYHVRRMKAASLLRQVDQEPTTRRNRAVFELVGREVVVDLQHLDDEQLEELVRSRRVLMRFAERSLEQGARRRTTQTDRVRLIQHHVRLGQRDLRELHRRMEELASWVAEHDTRGASQSCVLTLAVGPMPDTESNRER